MDLQRRAILMGATAMALTRDTGAEPRAPRAIFVSHGAPSLALDSERGGDLARWGQALPRPATLVVVSAHWERTPLAIGARAARPLLHDYGGFAPELRQVTYDAPVAAGLADDLAAGLAEFEVARDDARPWDHGVWVPLVHLFGERDVPVIQLSLPSHLPPKRIAALGARLGELLEGRALLVGSGGFVHNLRRIDWSESSPPPAWATDFEAWGRGALERGDLDELVDYRRRAPGLAHAHPTHEHWLPLLVAAGAAPQARAFPVEGFEYGSLSRLSVELF